MRKQTKAPAKPSAGKTVGVPMTTADLEALAAFRDATGKNTLVAPKEGPGALMLFRLGVETWKARNAGGA